MNLTQTRQPETSDQEDPISAVNRKLDHIIPGFQVILDLVQAGRLGLQDSDDPAITLKQKLVSGIPSNRLLLTRPEVAAYLGLSPKTLDLHGATRYCDLPFFKIGSRAMYRFDDVLNFIEGRRKNA